MGQTKGEGRAPAEKSQRVIESEAARRDRRERRQAEDAYWAAQNGPVAVVRASSVRLPHRDVPCAWCDRYVMDEMACPNAKDICTDCCGED
jgi:hypothetical protein